MSETAPETTVETTPPEGTDPAGDPQTFDREYVEKLRKQAAKYRTEATANAGAAKRLAELEESQKTEAQKLADRATAAEKAAADAQREMTRLKVIAEIQLDPDLHEFVTGDTEEDMRAKAEKLKARATGEPTTTQPGPRPDLTQGARGTALAGDGFEQGVKNLLGIR